MSATPFAARLAAVIVGVVMAASALTVTLDYMKFRRVLRQQEDLVYLFVAHDLAATIEDSMNLGLPLAALQTTEQLIQRRRTAERGTGGITVFDSTGMVLFDTDRFREGARLPEEWAPPQADAMEWKDDLDDAYLVGGRIVNNFGQTAGGVVVRYKAATLDARMNAILLDMVRAALLMMAVTTVVAFAGAILLTRRYRIWLSQAIAQLTATSPGATAVPVAAAGSEALMASIARTSAALDEAEAALLRIGTVDAMDAAIREPAHAA